MLAVTLPDPRTGLPQRVIRADSLFSPVLSLPGGELSGGVVTGGMTGVLADTPPRFQLQGVFEAIAPIHPSVINVSRGIGTRGAQYPYTSPPIKVQPPMGRNAAPYK